MNTSYEAWAKFDVDDALVHVDVLEQQQQIARQKQQKVTEKRRVEETIAHDAAQSAQVLAAHAAVAALKAKARSRGAKAPPVQPAKLQTNSEPTSTDPDTQQDESKAEELQHVAAMMQQKHALIKATMTARRSGDALLEARGACDWSAAKSAYESALTSAKALETMVPQLMDLQRRMETSSTIDGHPPHLHHDKDVHSTTESCSSHDYNHDHDHSHVHSHDHIHCPSDPPKPKHAVVETLPQKNDLNAIVKMFLKDCYMGLGACAMGTHEFAAASEALKEVLLRDDTYLLAWQQRGRTFEALDAPLLAWLHYNRITSLDPAFEDAKECEERINNVLMSGTTKQSDVPSATETRTLKDVLRLVKLWMDAGNVIMIEGFFEYAIRKYEKAIVLLSSVRTQHNPTGYHESVITKLETTCHMNIASCYLEMQKHYATAIKHCQFALENDPGHIVANFRLAQIRRAMHAYESALNSYHTVRLLISYLPPNEATKQLEKLEEEIDKCQFERSQYDTAFIRQQMQNESAL